MPIDYSELPLNRGTCFINSDEGQVNRALAAGMTVVYDNVENWNYFNSDFTKWYQLDGTFFAYM